MSFFKTFIMLVFCLPCVAEQNEVVVVNPELFMKEALVEPIKVEQKLLTDGSTVDCYVIKTKSVPLEHEMGPWGPKTITDGKDKGGIWFEGGKVYDVDGPFVKNMATFYKDPKWKLYNDDGTVKITETKEAFMAAARPNVDPKYKNHVVEGQAEWVEDLVSTYYIPVKPRLSEKPQSLGHGPIGVAFNGVNYDPPAPTHMILKAYTLAPLDDSGGHLNPFAGYHYHAVTGKTEEVKQADGHPAQIGYMVDGFALFAHDKDAKDLDECGGHTDAVRGYHYHAGEAGSNEIIKAYRGAIVKSAVGGRGGPPGGGGRGEKGSRPDGPPPHDHGDHTHPHTHPEPQVEE
ncbi:MAG: YHYH protein [Akkermansiaceae bacterium]